MGLKRPLAGGRASLRQRVDARFRTVVAFEDLVRSGKILYAGITIMPVWQFVTCVVTARKSGLTPFVSASNHYNLLWL